MINWCSILGHRWVPVYIRKSEWRFIACYCAKCRKGYKDIIDFVDKNSPTINSYDEKYYNEPNTNPPTQEIK